jgi:hypothetical protein
MDLREVGPQQLVEAIEIRLRMNMTGQKVTEAVMLVPGEKQAAWDSRQSQLTP